MAVAWLLRGQLICSLFGACSNGLQSFVWRDLNVEKGKALANQRKENAAALEDQIHQALTLSRGVTVTVAVSGFRPPAIDGQARHDPKHT